MLGTIVSTLFSNKSEKDTGKGLEQVCEEGLKPPNIDTTEETRILASPPSLIDLKNTEKQLQWYQHDLHQGRGRGGGNWCIRIIVSRSNDSIRTRVVIEASLVIEEVIVILLTSRNTLIFNQQGKV